MPISSRPEEAPDLLVLGLVGAGRIAPGVAPALVELDPEPAPDLGVEPLGQALGGLHAQAVDEELLGELAVGLELVDPLRDLVAHGHALERYHVPLGPESRSAR